MPVVPKGAGTQTFDEYLDDTLPAARERREKNPPSEKSLRRVSFDEFLSNARGDRSQIFSDTRSRAVIEADPVQINKENGIATQLNVPRSVVHSDPTAAEKDLRAENLIAAKKRLRRRNPRMALLMEDADFAEALQGSGGRAEPAEALTDIGLVEGLGDNWEFNNLQMDIGGLRWREALHVLELGDPLTKTEQATIRSLKGRQAQYQRYDTDEFWPSVAVAGADFVPSVINVMGESLEWGSKGFVAGLGLGGVAGLAGGPVAEVTVPAMALGTGLWLGGKGAIFGGIKGGIEMEGGSAYDGYLAEGIPPRIAAEAALLYGLVAGGIEAVSLSILGRVAFPGKKSLIGKAAQKIVSRQFGEKLVRRTLANASLKLAEGIATNYGQEYLQSLGEEVVGQQAFIESVLLEYPRSVVGQDPASAGKFPTRHPSRSGSNVRLMTRRYDDRVFVIPTMVEGEVFTPEDATAVAERMGLENYPSFPNEELAQKWIDQNHAKIAEDGSWGAAPWITSEMLDRAHQAGITGAKGGFVLGGAGAATAVAYKTTVQKQLPVELDRMDETADLMEAHGVDAQVLQQSAAVGLEGQASLYINARALVAAATQNPEVLTEVIGRVTGMDADSIAQAAEAGHDIEVSKVVWLTEIAGQKNRKLSELLRPLVKVDPTLESEAELALSAESVMADVEATSRLEEADQAQLEARKVERQRLESATYEMLRQTGQYNDSDARKLAKLMPAISIMAERAGVDMSAGVGAPVVMGPGGRGAGLAQGAVDAEATRGVALDFRDDTIPAPGGQWAGYRFANKRLSAAGALPAGREQRYFQETTKPVSRGPSGRRLKNWRTETTPGAAPGTAAFVDYKASDESIYIEYIATHKDYRGQGVASDLIDEIAARHPDASIKFSRVMTPAVGDIAERLKAEGRRVDYVADFGDYEASVKPRREKRVGPDTAAPNVLAQQYPLESRERWYADADYEARGASLVEMTPDEFLSRTKPLDIDEVTRENIDELRGKMERGEPLDPLTIYRDDLTDVRASDGRHRAIAAKELGMESVPVLDFTPRAAAPNVLEQGAAPSFKSTGLKVVSGQTDVRILDDIPKPELAKRRADLKRRILKLSPEAKTKYGLRTLTEGIDDKTVHEVAKNLAAIFHNMKLADKKVMAGEEKRLAAATNRALKKRTIEEIAEYFDTLYRGNRIDHRDATPRQIKLLEDRMFDEAMHAIQLHPEALGWYRENVALAMSVLQELDPDITQPENLLVFQLILAISSNGNDTGPNFNMSMKEYIHWRETGDIDGKAIHGKEVSTIRKSLSIAKEMLDTVGHEKLLEFLSRKGNAAELKAALIETFGFTESEAQAFSEKTGEVVSEVVPFSVVFGPKLGSFFNNLNGDYSTTTFDLWFMRWIGRQTGTYLKEVTEAEKAKRAKRFVTAAKAVPAAYRKQLGIELSKLKGKGVTEAGQKSRRHFTKEANRENLSKAQDDLRMAANGLFTSDRVDTPAGGVHRQWMRGRMGAVIDRLSDAGVQIEPADLQAVLWYLEKELYYAFGQQKKSDADDYAGAAEATYVELVGRPSGAYASGTGQVGAVGRLGPDAQGTEAGVSGQEVQQEGLASAFDPDPSSRSLMQGPANQLGLYTTLGRALTNSEQRKMEPQQVLGLLEKARVKKDEILWTGLEEYLEGFGPSDTINLDEVLEVLSFVRLDETTLRSWTLDEQAAADEQAIRGAYPIENLIVRELPIDGHPHLDAAWIRDKRDADASRDWDQDQDAPIYSVGFMRDGEYKETTVWSAGEIFDLPAEERIQAFKEQTLREAEDTVLDDDSENLSPLEIEIEKLRPEAPIDVQYPAPQWQEPGGENYRETLIRLPDTGITPAMRADPATMANIEQGIVPRNAFTGGHFGDTTPNVLVWVRWNERQGANGERVLFIEEVQDDWAKEGRKDGYGSGLTTEETEELARLQAMDFSEGRAELDEFHASMSAKYGAYPSNGVMDRRDKEKLLTEDEFQTGERLWDAIAIPQQRIRDLIFKEEKSRAVPDRPFKKTSHELALKRMLVIAAKEGFDAVAWTPGHMQVDRYETELRRTIDSIEYRRSTESVRDNKFEVWADFPDGRSELVDEFDTRENAEAMARDWAGSPQGERLKVVAPDSIDEHIVVTPFKGEGDLFVLYVDPDTGRIFDSKNVDVAGKQLSDVIGQKMAKQILEDEAAEGKLEGKNLTIGGKGFEDIYDTQLVKAANKIGKDFGAQVSEEPATFDPDRAAIEKAGAFYEQNMRIESVKRGQEHGFSLADENGDELGWFPYGDEHSFTIPLAEKEELLGLQQQYQNGFGSGTDFIPIVERIHELQAKLTQLDDEAVAAEEQALEKARAAKDEYIAQKVEESGVLGSKTRDIHTLPITPELRASAVEEGLPLFQAQDTGPRGMIEFLDDGQAIIRLLESADWTTFIHESGHLYLEHMARLVDAGASNEFTEDWRTVLDWFGRNAKTLVKWVKANEADLVNRFGQTAFDEAVAGDVKMIQALAARGDIRVGSGSQGVLAVAMQEMWAETFEGYVTTGKAPSLRLKKAFQAFTRWMMQIYGEIRNEQLLSDDITEVMDRMIATDEEMAAARKDLMLTETPGLALEGRSKEQFLEALEQAKAEALEETNKRIVARERRTQSKRWKENLKTILEEVREDLMKQPTYQADHWLRTGKWIDPENEPEGLPPAEKISLKALKRLYGQETVDALLGGRTGHYQRKGGLEPGAVVMNLALDLESGDELVAELVALVPFEEAAAQEADRRMIEKYGRPDDLLREATEEIIHSTEGQELALKLEMKQLATLRSAMRRPARVQIATEGIRTPAQMAEEITAAQDELLMARAENEMRKIAGQEANETRMREAKIGLEAARVRASEAKDQREVQAILKRKALAIEQAANQTNAKMKEVARRKVDATPSAMIRPDRFRTAEQKAAREERKALREGDYEAAEAAMRRRVFNFHAYRMALESRSEQQRHVKYLKNFLKKSWIDRINKAGGDHSGLIYGLLDQFDLRVSVSGKAALERGALRNALAEMTKRGEFAHVASYLMGEEQEDGTFGEPLRKHFKAMTPGELKDLRDAVESLYHHAKKTIEANEAKRQALIERVLSGVLEIQSRSNRKRDPDALEADTPFSARLIRRARALLGGQKVDESVHREGARHQLHALLTKPEWLFKWMDGDTNLGFAWTTFYKPFSDARDKAADRLDQLNKKLEKIYKAHYKRKDMALWRLNDHQSVWIDLGEGVPVRFTKEKLIALGLHAGNTLNRDAVMDSMGWDESVYEFILSHLDQNDWSFIQSIWDLIESQWPESAKLHKEMTGVTPKKEAAREVFTKWGTLRGGYYPIAWNPKSDPRIAAAMDEKEVAGLFGGAWSSAMTEIGHLAARQEHSGLKKSRQLKLSLTVIDNHLKQTTHDIFFRKPVVEINRYFTNEKIGQALKLAIGTENLNQLQNWLVAIAANTNSEPAIDKWTERLAKRTRVGYTTAAIGLKLSTALVQPTGYIVSIARLGEYYAIKGLWDYYGRFKVGPKDKSEHVKNMSEFVWKRSAFMRSRQAGGFDRDIGAARSSLTSRSMLKEVDEFSFWMIGFAQQGVDMPTWLGAYAKAMDGKADGVRMQDEGAAIEFADQTVRLSQSHGSIVDLAQMQRGPEIKQLFTTFYSFWSSYYNNMAHELGWTNFDRDIKRPRQIANLFYLLYLMPYLEEAMRNGEFGPPEEDTDPALWYLKLPFVTASNVIPVVSSLVNAFDSGWMRSPSVVGSVIETGVAVGEQTVQWAKGEGTDRAMYKAYADGFGYATRLPTPALFKYSEALYYYVNRDDITFHDMAYGVPREKRSTD